MMKMFWRRQDAAARWRPRRACSVADRGCTASSSPSVTLIGLVGIAASSPATSCPLRQRRRSRGRPGPGEHRGLRQRLPPAVHRPADEPRRADRSAVRASPMRPRSTRRSTRSSRTCWRHGHRLPHGGQAMARRPDRHRRLADRRRRRPRRSSSSRSTTRHAASASIAAISREQSGLTFTTRDLRRRRAPGRGRRRLRVG